MKVTFRPINIWPEEKAKRHMKSPFEATFNATEILLDHELRQLHAKRVVIQLDIGESEIRLDGMPRANAKPQAPGVILSFESNRGPLRYLTDRFDHWHANLRAIALGLEALRRIDRYGITRRGEQYTGWKQIEAAGSGASPSMAQQLIDSYGGLRKALKATHPDNNGGDEEEFRRVQEARKVLGT